MANVKNEMKTESGPKPNDIGNRNRNIPGGKPGGGPANQKPNAGPGPQGNNRFGNRGPQRNDDNKRFMHRNLSQVNLTGPNEGFKGNDFKGGRGRGGPPGERFGGEDRFLEKLLHISGPSLDLPAAQDKEKKFLGNCRLYVGNAGTNFTDQDLAELFKPYGEVHEPFYNKEKNFGFIKLDYRVNAEKAKKELDGKMKNGKILKIRFAPPGTIVKVKNLSEHVSNELLELAFGVFGEVDRAVIIVDERNNSTHEGLVEFARKPGAAAALRKCQEGCFFLTSDLRPAIVEACEPVDDVDGLPDKNLNRKTAAFFKAREVGPRFAKPGSFEYEYGSRWKSLHELYQQKLEALKREMKLEEEKLEAQMEYARYEHETEMLREQLRKREGDRERQKMEWELKERQAEEQRRQDEELMRRQSEELSLRMVNQEEELRRRQQGNMMYPQEQPPFNEPFDRRGSNPVNNFERNDVPRGNGRGGDANLGRWAPAERHQFPGPDDFQNKRRRY